MHPVLQMTELVEPKKKIRLVTFFYGFSHVSCPCSLTKCISLVSSVLWNCLWRFASYQEALGLLVVGQMACTEASKVHSEQVSKIKEVWQDWQIDVLHLLYLSPYLEVIPSPFLCLREWVTSGETKSFNFEFNFSFSKVSGFHIA